MTLAVVLYLSFCFLMGLLAARSIFAHTGNLTSVDNHTYDPFNTTFESIAEPVNESDEIGMHNLCVYGVYDTSGYDAPAIHSNIKQQG